MYILFLSRIPHFFIVQRNRYGLDDCGGDGRSISPG